MLVLLVIEPRSSSPMASHVLLTGLSQFIRADVVRTTQLNGEKWAEYVALMKSKLMYTKLWFKIVVEERIIGRLRR
jgi:hypothetical protein